MKGRSENTEKTFRRYCREVYMDRIKRFLAATPFTTRLYMILNAGVPQEFYHDNVVCEKCGHIEEKASYAIAQRAMGNKIVFTCDCGNKINL